VLDAALAVHNKLGPGLSETLYEIVLAHELYRRGVTGERQKAISIRYEGLIFDDAFRADLVVERVLIVELKSVEALTPVHSKQLQTQLKVSGLRAGLLINFGEAYLKDGIKRLSNGGLEEAVGF
jgi:GxxExxY protein